VVIQIPLSDPAFSTISIQSNISASAIDKSQHTGDTAVQNKVLLVVVPLLAGCTQFPQFPTVPVTGYVPTSDYLTRQTQIQLIRLGYLHDGADGILGPHTQNAINNFEQANGMPMDGHPSLQLLAALQVSRAIASVAPAVVPTPPVEDASSQQTWVQPTDHPDPLPQPQLTWAQPKQQQAQIPPDIMPPSASAGGWVHPK
jgi:Putative peptidoglycan binding domain